MFIEDNRKKVGICLSIRIIFFEKYSLKRNEKKDREVIDAVFIKQCEKEEKEIEMVRKMLDDPIYNQAEKDHIIVRKLSSKKRTIGEEQKIGETVVNIVFAIIDFFT